MEDRELRSYEMVLRVRAFGAENAARFPPATLGGELFATIGAAAEELAGHAAAQVSGSSSARRGTATKAVARAALREELEMMRRTARSMALTTPGLDAKFRIPRNMTDQQLLATAQAFALDAVPLKGEFIRFGMSTDFLEDLNADIADLETALSSQQSGKSKQVMATAAIDDVLERALAAVRQLDAVVRNIFRDDPARLAAWQSARHVERARRSNAATPPTPPTNPPA
jgi:hypothetical protein